MRYHQGGLPAQLPMSIVHLIYRDKHYETQAKDYEFSRVSMEEHWQAGAQRHAPHAAPRGPVAEAAGPLEAVRTFDITRDFD